MLFQLSLTICCCCYCYNLLLLLVLIIIMIRTNSATGQDFSFCNTAFGCGNGLSIYYPFWSAGFSYCGYPGFRFYCGNQVNGRPMLNISNNHYYIEDYQQGSSILIVNQDFYENPCPRPRRNFTDHAAAAAFNPFFVDKKTSTNFTYFLNCTSKPPYVDPIHFDPSNFHRDCLDYNNTIRSYAYGAEFINPKLLEWSWKYCEENVVVPVVSDNGKLLNFMEDNTLGRGFRVTWSTPIGCESCEKAGGLCVYNEMKRNFTCSYCELEGEKFRLNQSKGGYDCVLPPYHPHNSPNSGAIAGVVLGLLTMVIIIVLFVCLLCRRKKTRETTDPNVDLFLENYGSLSLQRYRYKDIKKMTNSFKDKLGQGGYGSVFKGKLVDGRLVAVKVLTNDPQKTTNGEEFMNEVATIGRTNHVNIVALLGFCSSGSKRALVYEFMPNGSLDKFIHEKKDRTTIETTSTSTTSTTTTEHLGWEKLYQISLGIARGLEYLHRGCNTGRILHFDIKPHNILLDENFCPKVSDFGLAKLCPTRDSIVSMLTGGRGTLGYIAPEVYCRNFGGVSYKSDVYSYGMMVLEMVGGRKNIDPFVENTSEIYFPHWIHDRLQEQKDKNIEDLLRLEGAIEEELAKKMIMVGLWCIQTNPAHRPSMSRVAEMLEGRIEDLKMPPKPIVDLSSLPPPT